MLDTQLLYVMCFPKDIYQNFYVELQFSKFRCFVSLLVFIFANPLTFLNNCMTSYEINTNKKTIAVIYRLFFFKQSCITGIYIKSKAE